MNPLKHGSTPKTMVPINTYLGFGISSNSTLERIIIEKKNARICIIFNKMKGLFGEIILQNKKTIPYPGGR
jgi:hypothetical protein